LHYLWPPAGESEFHENQRIFAHRGIDAGADLVVCSGPHVLQAIERYAAGTIYHGIGNFMFQRVNTPHALQSFHRWPNGQAWYESFVVVTPLVPNGTPRNHALVPIAINEDPGSPDYGVPQLASGEQAAAILSRLTRSSAKYGIE